MGGEVPPALAGASGNTVCGDPEATALVAPNLKLVILLELSLSIYHLKLLENYNQELNFLHC